MKTVGSILTFVGLGALTATFVTAGGCSASKSGAGAGPGDDGGSGDDSTCYVCSSGGGASSGGNDGSFNLTNSTSGGGGMYGTAINLAPDPKCATNSNTTTISGRVFDPANVNPVYNVTVFVPHTQPLPMPAGAVCSCSSLYPKVDTYSVTDANGYFKITNAPPAGPNGGPVPLVLQSGKWRMQTTVKVTECVDNPIADHTLRLPKNHTEGDIPQIAISTGAADSLECLLTRMGIDQSEYVGGAGTANGGHIHIFTGAGGVGGAALQGGVAYDPGQWLWDKDADIMPYDVVLFSCEGGETAHIDANGQQVVLDYANKGGRVFASHFHYALFNTGPFATTPKAPVATWTTGANIDNDPINGIITTTLTNAPTKTFAEGAALKQWLGNVGALTNGTLPIHYGRDNAKVTMANTPSQLWISADNASLTPGNAQYFSFDTPFAAGGDLSCAGRVVYSDLHVSGGPNNMSDPNTDYPGFSPGIVPNGCTQHPLTPQEKALEFMILDLSSCLIPINMPPPPIITM